VTLALSQAIKEGRLRDFIAQEEARGIAVVIIPVIKGLGSNLKTTFGSVSSALK
jgi:hypothetical protein